MGPFWEVLQDSSVSFQSSLLLQPASAALVLVSDTDVTAPLIPELLPLSISLRRFESPRKPFLTSKSLCLLMDRPFRRELEKVLGSVNCLSGSA